jgi:hypothetical protein
VVIVTVGVGRHVPVGAAVTIEAHDVAMFTNEDGQILLKDLDTGLVTITMTRAQSMNIGAGLNSPPVRR